MKVIKKDLDLMDDQFREQKNEIRITPTPEEVRTFVKGMDKIIKKFLKKDEEDN